MYTSISFCSLLVPNPKPVPSTNPDKVAPIQVAGCCMIRDSFVQFVNLICTRWAVAIVILLLLLAAAVVYYKY